MTTRRSALPVRMSYRVKVRSEPTEARIEDAERLKRMAETVSEEVECVRFDMGTLLVRPEIRHRYLSETEQETHFVSSHTCTMFEAVANNGSVRW